MALSLDKIQPGYFYQINPTKLTAKHPAELKRIQFVKVSFKTESSITVIYPSLSSLRSYFTRGQTSRTTTPALDETYEMDVEVAREVFVKKIPRDEEILSFWSSITGGGRDGDGVSKKNWYCWGKRQVRSFNRRRRNSSSNYDLQLLSSSAGGEDEDDQMDSKEDEGGGGGGGGRDGEREMGLLSKKSRKRNGNHAMKTMTQKGKRAGNKNGTTNAGEMKIRWSEERYKLAKHYLHKIMKKKEAAFNNPISRLELRAEARKSIRDTGLLDHLLKHMPGKLAPGGEERFQRQCNAENGSMEYWLESTHLPDWQPGNNPRQHPDCAREIKELKKKVNASERGMKELTKYVKQGIKEIKEKVNALERGMKKLTKYVKQGGHRDTAFRQCLKGGSKVLPSAVEERLYELDTDFRGIDPPNPELWPLLDEFPGGADGAAQPLDYTNEDFRAFPLPFDPSSSNPHPLPNQPTSPDNHPHREKLWGASSTPSSSSD